MWNTDGRIQLSPEILTQLGNPKIVYPKIKGEIIELHSRPEFDTLDEQIGKFECFSCNSIQREKFCAICGKPTIQIN